MFSHHPLLNIWDWKYCSGNLSSKMASPADFIGWLAKNARPPAACPLSNSPLIHRFLLPPSKFVGLEVTFPANLWKEKICWCKFHTMYLHVTSSAFSLYVSLSFLSLFVMSSSRSIHTVKFSSTTLKLRSGKIQFFKLLNFIAILISNRWIQFLNSIPK